MSAFWYATHKAQTFLQRGQAAPPRPAAHQERGKRPPPPDLPLRARKDALPRGLVFPPRVIFGAGAGEAAGLRKAAPRAPACIYLTHLFFYFSLQYLCSMRRIFSRPTGFIVCSATEYSVPRSSSQSNNLMPSAAKSPRSWSQSISSTGCNASFSAIILFASFTLRHQTNPPDAGRPAGSS